MVTRGCYCQDIRHATAACHVCVCVRLVCLWVCLGHAVVPNQPQNKRNGKKRSHIHLGLNALTAQVVTQHAAKGEAPPVIKMGLFISTPLCCESLIKGLLEASVRYMAHVVRGKPANVPS